MELTRDTMHKILDRELDKKGVGAAIECGGFGHVKFELDINVKNEDVRATVAILSTTTTYDKLFMKT